MHLWNYFVLFANNGSHINALLIICILYGAFFDRILDQNDC